MKKILLQFLALALVICGIFLVSGRTKGWIEPKDDGVSTDIVLSGTKYNGKVVVAVTLHPDGTGEHEGNGEKTPATWETNADGTMVVHFNMKGTDYDMTVRDAGDRYTADYPLVADFELSGGKPVKAIVLSGSKYNGKVVVAITLNPDGTGEHEGNGEKTPATWETNADGTMVAHFNVKGTDYDMTVREENGRYVANYPLVADFELSGSKDGTVAASAEAAEPTAAPAESTAAPAQERPTEAAAEPIYPPHTLVLPFTADINDQLSTTFHAESSVWGTALGASGSYEPKDSADLLFSWTGAGKSNELDFFANGTYEYRFTKMGVTEHGTWNFKDWHCTLTSEKGREMEAEMTK